MFAVARVVASRMGLLRIVMLSAMLGLGSLLDAPVARGQADDLEAQEEQAFTAAVGRVSASVVRIETIGGLETVGAGKSQILLGLGPTTGVIVSADGYIISSAFNFIQKPARILVGLPDGSRVPAQMVATDHNRMLTLLKIETGSLDVDNLNVPQTAPLSEVRIGQWALAVGRTFEGTSPNLSVGIVSAKNRIWGKAIQTDAKISPANYGGPLVDIQGRVLGILVPMSPQRNDELAGVEWYDSGIGFAIPLADVFRVLPELKKGHDLHSGVLGVAFKSQDELSGEPVIGVVRANSPAANAGLQVGDKIVELQKRPVRRIQEVKIALGPHYAGESVELVIERGKERLPKTVTLVGKLEPFEHRFLGILPARTETKDGVPLRFVFPGSPAAEAGLKAGDILTRLAGKDMKTAQELREALNGQKLGIAVELTVLRNGQPLNPTPSAKLTTLPETVPSELPPTVAARGNPPANRPPLGLLADRKIPEFENVFAIYVPESYDPAIPCGVVLWLPAPGTHPVDELVEKFRARCQQHDLILVVPKSSDAQRWQPNEASFLQKVLADVQAAYEVDANRIVVASEDVAGGGLGYLLAFQQRELIRGVAVANTPLTGTRAGDNEPNRRLAFFLANSTKGPRAAAVTGTITGLRNLKFPVTLVEQGEQPRGWNDAELDQLARWIDCLDRL